MPDRKYSSPRAAILLAAVVAALALSVLQGCASSDTSTSDATTASGNGTRNREQLLHMGISEDSYANRNSGNRH